MRTSVLSLALGLLVGCAGGQSGVAASSDARCIRTEQVGCIEFDLLNLAWDEKHLALVGLDRPYASQEERYDRAINLGPRLYEAHKAGSIASAGMKQFTIYMWNVGDIPKSHMSAYDLRSAKGPLIRHGVDEIAPVFGATFDPAYDIGSPDRVFRVSTDGSGAALQVPWSMIGQSTYILVCTGDRATVYPNRRTANQGLWLTPEYLNAIRAKGWEYILMPFLSIPS